MSATDHTRAGLLLLVDVQYSFLPGGSLAVPGGDDILGTVNTLLRQGRFRRVVASQDYHPPNHISFASTHHAEPFASITVTDPRNNQPRTQELWPDHCIQGTKGSEIETSVKRLLDDMGSRAIIVQKGTDVDLDAYSALASPLASHNEPSYLERLIETEVIQDIVVVGLATDYCVKATTLDVLRVATKLKSLENVYVVREGVRGVDAGASQSALEELAAAGAQVVSIRGKELSEYLDL